MTSSTGPDDWRRGVPPPSRSGTPDGPSWRASRGGPTPFDGVNWKRWAAGIGAGLALLICLAIIISLLQFLNRRSTELILVTVPEYVSDGMPFNGFAFADQQALQAIPQAAGALQGFQVEEVDQLQDVNRNPKADVLIIYLNLIGGQDEHGIFFYPRDAEPDEPARRLRPDQLWTALSSLPIKQHKLLLLDIGRVPLDWRLGQLSIDFRTSLQRAVDEVPNLTILTASSVGERSWTSADLGQSVFGYFVGRALAGEADTNKDKNVTLAEFVRFVTTNTQNWVFNNRDELNGQHPQLFTKRDDKEPPLLLIRVGSQAVENPRSDAAAADATSTQLRQLWSARDRLLGTDGPATRFPLLWTQFQSLLLRAEAGIDAGQFARAGELIQRGQECLNQLEDGQRETLVDLASCPFYENDQIRRAELPKPDDVLRADAKLKFPLPEDLFQQQLTQFPGEFPSEKPFDPAIKQQTMQLRRLSESALARAGGAIEWVRPLIELGDSQRRAGEDRLFVLAIDEPAVRTSLDQARETYQTAIRHAAIVNDAHARFARLLPQLTAFSEWAAWQPGDAAFEHRVLNAVAEHAAGFANNTSRLQAALTPLATADAAPLNRLQLDGLSLFCSTRELKALLATPTQKADLIDRIQSSTRNIDQAWNRIHSVLLNEAQELRQLRPESPQPIHRRRLNSILRYALLPAELRDGLRQQVRSAEEQMSRRTERASLERELPAVARQERAEQSQTRRGLWQSLWILNIFSIEPPGGFGELTRIWTQAVETSASGEASPSLLSLGDGIRQGWASLRRQCAEYTTRDVSDFAAHGELLEQACRSALLVHGFDTFTLVNTVNPNQKLLRWQLMNRVLCHCDRHLDGFWISPADQQRPWFEEVTVEGLSLLERLNRDARFRADSLIQQRRDLLQQRRQARVAIRLSGKEKIRFNISQTKFQVPLELKDASGSLPSGQAIAWLLARETSPLTIAGNGSTLPVQSTSYVFELQPSRITGDIDPDCKTLDLQPTLFFRGHRWTAATALSVDPCRAPGRVERYTAHAESGSIIVTGRDERTVLFVLDCSLSMRDKVPGKSETKFDVAIDNLTEIISTMTPDDRVGLVAFAHRVGYDSSAEGERRLNKNWNASWIDRLGAIPADLNWDDDYQLLVPVNRLRQNRSAFLAMLREVKTLGPHGNTPLVGAITFALGEENLSSLGGSVIAITDGAADDANSRTEVRLQTLLKRRRASCHIVGFGFNVATPTEVKQVENLKKTAAAVGAVYANAPGAQELIGEVTRALQSRPFVVQSLRSADEWTSPLEQPVENLTPGPYQVLFGDLPPLAVGIAGGERLSFGISLDDGLLQRAPVNYKLGIPAINVPLSAAAPDYCAYQTFQLDGQQRARLVLSLDLVGSGGNDRTFARRPEEIEFEIRPADATERPSFTWRLQPQETLPTWEFLIDNWPPGGPAHVQAWWKIERTPPDIQLTWAEVEKAFNTEQAHPVRIDDTLPELNLVARRPEEGKLQIALSSPSAAPTSEKALNSLANLRVQLGQMDVRGQFQPYELSYSRDFSAQDGSLILEFNLSQGIQLNESVLALTTVASRRANAVSLREPLIISRFDSIGVKADSK